MDCIFCKIANGEIPSKKIYEDEYLIAFLDINPLNPGHTLIVPKKHFQDLSDIDEETLNKIMHQAKILKRELENKLNCDGLSLIQNNGEVQEVKHFHLHLNPFYKMESTLSIDEVYEILK